MNQELWGVIIVNEFNEYVLESFSTVGDIVIKAMMGGWTIILQSANGRI